MAAEPLSEAAVEAALKELNGWSVEGDALVKTFSLPSYAAGLMFATMIGAMAEGHNHHPELTIGYKKVRVAFTTHDAGNKISQKDVEIARAIDALPYPRP
jgi:4a-hydroxytetrahydrobiopterin dehydratase